MTKLFPFASTIFVPLTCIPAALRGDCAESGDCAECGECAECAHRAACAATSTNPTSAVHTAPTITAFLIDLPRLRSVTGNVRVTPRIPLRLSRVAAGPAERR